MLLRNISDQDLLKNTKTLVRKESEIISQVITHLEEIEVRKLYSDLKYKSLYDYCTDELGYTKDQAYRRISAMRLGRKLPEAKHKLANGKINLSSVNMLASLINDDKNMPKKEQNDILHKIEGKTKKVTERILNSIRAEKGILPTTKRTHIKNESNGDIRLSISISKKTMDKINQIKGLYGHQNKELDELLDLMADSLLEKYEENLKPKKSFRTKNTKGRYISKSVKLSAYQKAQGKCEICGSTHKLQYDHIQPRGRFGPNDKNNIRLLCQNCNLRQGVIHFGADIMKRRLL